MDKHIVASAGTFAPEVTYYRSSDNKTEELNGNDSQYTTFDAIFQQFFAFDGHTSRSLMPFPHDPFREPAPWKNYDPLSVSDRIEQLRASVSFSDKDLDMFESLTNGSGLTQADKRGFTEFLFWWALGGHSMAGITEANGVWKVGKGGMTEFARRVFDDYEGDVLFGAEVVKVSQPEGGERVQVVVAAGVMVVGRAGGAEVAGGATGAGRGRPGGADPADGRGQHGGEQRDQACQACRWSAHAHAPRERTIASH